MVQWLIRGRQDDRLRGKELRRGEGHGNARSSAVDRMGHRGLCEYVYSISHPFGRLRFRWNVT